MQRAILRLARFVVPLALLALPLPNLAQSTQRDIAVLSFEDTSCGAWERSNSEPPTRQVYLYWFRGFVSGYNYGSPRYQVSLQAMPDPDTLVLFIDKFCKEQPLRPFTSAAFQLVHEQRARSGK
jgi:hypothetical protein